MILQTPVGIIGFWFHGAPPLAPLLFPNLVGLALIGIWALIPHVPESESGRSWLGLTHAWAHSRAARFANE